ncbi:MAG: VOC family protein [Gammaproteobacteria bacterium]|nr:VOC family protein [Gammaproteobacteria bacterium]
MTLTGLVPILKCRSVDRSLKFYKDSLHFIEIRTRKNTSETEWAYIKSDQTYLMLELDSDVQLQTHQSISLYFYSDDVKSFHQYMKAKQYSISDLEQSKYGLLQCYFSDPDGHKIMIGELIK